MTIAPALSRFPNDAVPVELTCAEVWGGNRPVDLAIASPGLRGWMLSEPFEGGRGGDVHYVSVCGSGLLSRLCVADVAGHGEKVSGISQVLHRQLRRHMDTLDQRAVLRKLNAELCDSGFDVFATAALLTYYPPSRKLSVSYAGHPPAWVLRRSTGTWTQMSSVSDGEAERSGGGQANLPLAVAPDVTYSRATVRLDIGDRVLVLTDGVIEAMNRTGAQFGDAALLEFLNTNRDTPARELVQGLHAAVREWNRGERQDDVTILATDVVAGPPGPAVWTVLKNQVLRPLGLLRK